MPGTNGLFKLHGKIQHYQWGGYEYIPHLLSVDNTARQPFAEYWLGAHDNASAELEDHRPLNELLRENPALLGQKVQQTFGRLPYLLKVLDVKDMLSIQVHPNKAAAIAAFANENATAKALTSSDRNYKDDNHKPELMVALSDFWLLHGFKDASSIKQTIHHVSEFAFMLPLFEQQGYEGLYAFLMNMEQQEANRALQPLLNRIVPLFRSGKLQKDTADYWAAKAAIAFNELNNIDKGIFSVYLLNLVHLKKGEAIFQDAGVLHAYLEGQNVEIMANSDNVLRGGLTSKKIDVPELMKHVLFHAVAPVIVQATNVNSNEKKFVTPAPDFELSIISIPANKEYILTTASAEIFLVMDGNVDAIAGNAIVHCKRGEAFIGFDHITVTLNASKTTTIYRAAVPA